MKANEHVNEQWNAYRVPVHCRHLANVRPVVLMVCSQVSCVGITWELVKQCKLSGSRTHNLKASMRTIVLDLLWADDEEAGQVLADVFKLLKFFSEPPREEPRETHGECLHFLSSCPWGTQLSFPTLSAPFSSLWSCASSALLDFPNLKKRCFLFCRLFDKLIWGRQDIVFFLRLGGSV